MPNGTRNQVCSWICAGPIAEYTRPTYASSVHASVTRGPRLGPPIDGCARKIRKNRIAVGGMVAAAHSASQCITGLCVVTEMNVQRCHAETTNVNAANEV